jgi:hypothetical protein
MTDEYDKIIARAYRRWVANAESHRDIADRLIAAIQPADWNAEIAGIKREVRSEVEIAREVSREAMATVSRYERLVGSPENFVRMKEEMNARQKAQDDRELELRWREDAVWSGLLNSGASVGHECAPAGD